MNGRKGSGFTLIELMITLGILGILVAIAVPAYFDYVARAKISEALLAAYPYKTMITEFRVMEGRFPKPSELNSAWSGDDVKIKENPSQYVKEIWLTYGADVGPRTAISVVVNLDAVGLKGKCSRLVVALKPRDTVPAQGPVNAIDWECYARHSAPKECASYVPSSCRKTA